jgi:aspartate-semialdehyde dehydrogenase
MTQHKLRVGVLAATHATSNHGWSASAQSAGKSYADAVAGRWTMPAPVPRAVGELIVIDASDVARVAERVDFVCCAVDMPKDATAKLEENYARAETPVISNNSAHRWTPDVPMMIPEINSDHAAIIDAQRARLGTRRGFIAAKPNCSLQSYVPAIHPLRAFVPTKIAVCTYQALSGAGKTFESWPEMHDNVIPVGTPEEQKSEQEPLKIWGTISGGKIVNASAPVPFLRYLDDDARPQTKLDRDAGNGQAISIGRLRPDAIFDWRFVALSHNTLRGAAGGAVLTAELLVKDGYLAAK